MNKIIFVIGLVLAVAVIVPVVKLSGVFSQKKTVDDALQFVGSQTGSKEVEMLIKEREQAKSGVKLSIEEKKAQKIEKIDAEISDLEAGNANIAKVIKQMNVTGTARENMEQAIKKSEARIAQLKEDRAGLIK